MRSPTLRRLAVLLTWLALALLPLRGWAALVMPLQHEAPATAVVALPPCHGEVDAGAADGSDAGHACAMCDLCHASIAALPTVVRPVVEPAAAAPPVAPAATVEPAVRAGPERPPRAG